MCALTLELSGGGAVRLDDGLGAARHQRNQELMRSESHAKAHKHDEGSLPREAKMCGQRHASEKRNACKHGEP